MRLTGRLPLEPSRVAAEDLPAAARLAFEVGRFAASPGVAAFARERFVACAEFVVFRDLDGPPRLAADFVTVLTAFFATAFFAGVFFAADFPAAAFVDTGLFEAAFFTAFVFTPAFFELDFFAAAFLRGLVVLIMAPRMDSASWR